MRDKQFFIIFGLAVACLLIVIFLNLLPSKIKKTETTIIKIATPSATLVPSPSVNSGSQPVKTAPNLNATPTSGQSTPPQQQNTTNNNTTIQPTPQPTPLPPAAPPGLINGILHKLL